ncbi:MAG: FG-GAP repeat protein [Armatimonadetes bacterium]|nr:FG-GAP repeat protein [Anaerolineae bacterium]
MFTSRGIYWIEQKKLTEVEGALYALYGSSVALTTAGDMALVGAYGDEIGINGGQGSAYSIDLTLP